MTAPGFLPDSVIPIAQACQKQYELCNDLIVDEKGVSTISMEDFAVALLDEAEQAKHEKIRFSVTY